MSSLDLQNLCPPPPAESEPVAKQSPGDLLTLWVWEAHCWKTPMSCSNPSLKLSPLVSTTPVTSTWIPNIRLQNSGMLTLVLKNLQVWGQKKIEGRMFLGGIKHWKRREGKLIWGTWSAWGTLIHAPSSQSDLSGERLKKRDWKGNQRGKNCKYGKGLEKEGMSVTRVSG